MVVRRVVYRLIFPLAVVLPVWVLIGRGIIADGVGWQFVAYLFIAPVLFIALIATGGLLVARSEVRAERAVSWPDVAVLSALWLALIGVGLFAYPWLAVCVVLLVLGLFWLAIWELIASTRRVFTEFNERVQAQARGSRQAAPIDMGEVIVVNSTRIEEERKPLDGH